MRQTIRKRESCIVCLTQLRQHYAPQIKHARVCAAVIDHSIKFGKCGRQITELTCLHALSKHRLASFRFRVRLEQCACLRTEFFDLCPSCSLNMLERPIDNACRGRFGFEFGGGLQILFRIESELLRNQCAIIEHACVTSPGFDDLRQLSLRPVEITDAPRFHRSRHLIRC